MVGSVRLYAGALIVSWIFFFVTGAVLAHLFQKQKTLNERLRAEIKQTIEFPPPVTSNDDLNVGKSHFTFSPDKHYIAFIQDAYGAYGDDWDRAWALKLFSLEGNAERTLFVDDIHMSDYEWLNAGTIRVFHDGGTGVRAYRDIDIRSKKTLFFKDYKGADADQFWTMDDAYARNMRNAQDAFTLYTQLTELKK